MQMKNFLTLAIVFILVLALYNLMNPQGQQAVDSNEVSYSEFLTQIDRGEIRDVVIQGDTIRSATAGGPDTHAMLPPEDHQTLEFLRNTNTNITVEEEDTEGNFLVNLLINFFPVFLVMGMLIFFMRQMQGGGRGGAMGFGKSKARLLTEASGVKTFDDVAGIDEAKEELQEIVDFLKDPTKYQRLGGKIPKGALLIGPPGTGKTLLARAVAGEANVPFFTISGSDFVEMFVGVGASRVRDMFEQAKKNAPCIIFIDEIDAVGRSRGAGHGGGNDEREQTLNQLLVEMDGFEANEGIILVAATNRPDVLDPALLRPGRFDRQVEVPNPDIIGREKILKVHMREVPLASDVDPKVIARGTPGFSGADLANLVNEAALLAARRNKRVVAMSEMEEAKDKVMMGPERRSIVISEEEKRKTAYHEAGHAIVSLQCPASDPIHKATIIPRGRALGMVMRLPEEDSYSYARDKMYANLAVAMGGRVAEEIILGFDKVTSGASGDIQMATQLARSMVTQWGMSDKLGNVLYSTEPANPYLGGGAVGKSVSEETARLIDSEIRRLVDEAYDKAGKILKKNSADLETLAQGLIEYETLSGDEIVNLLKGIAPERPEDEPPTPSDTPTGAVPTTEDPVADAKPDDGGADPEPQGA